MGSYTIDWENKKIIMHHDVGFFSNCTITLRALMEETRQSKTFFSIDTSKQWSYYKDSNEDIYNKFFETSEEIFEVTDEKFSKSNDEDQFSDYGLINYNVVNPFVKKYFKLNQEVKNIEKKIIQKYQIEFDKTICVLYRGNDKCKETNLPTYEDMDIKLSNIVEKYPNHKILIQSDEIEFCDFMLKYKNSFVIDEVEKINKTKENAIQHIIPIGNKVSNAQKFLSVMSIMSKCDVVLLNSGNVGMWVCLLRGDFKNVYQFLNPKKPHDFYWINR